MLLLKTALAVIGACGIGYAGYTYKTINEYQAFKSKTELAVQGISDKLDVVIRDIEYHHKSGDVKVSR